MHLVLFIVFAGLCLAGAINLLLQTHPINSALSLVVVMGSLAVEYLLLGAEFVAAVQVIVYAGAVMVLFVFVIMLLNAGVEERTKGSRVALLFGVPGMLIGSVLIGWVLIERTGNPMVPAGALPGAPKVIGWLLFHRHRPKGEGLMVPISYYLILSGILFACGVTGFLIKRNIISIFISIELMLNGVNLSFVAFAAQWHALSGQIFVFFVMVVAAAEAAVGLAIIIAVFRARSTLAVDRIDLMKL